MLTINMVLATDSHKIITRHLQKLWGEN